MMETAVTVTIKNDDRARVGPALLAEVRALLRRAIEIPPDAPERRRLEQQAGRLADLARELMS